MRVLIALSALMMAAAGLAQAQPDAPPGVPPGMAARLSAERVGAVQPGIYSAGENANFTLQPYKDGKYLLRFAQSTENFVLTVERGSLGAKILRYDTGTVALRVSVWGGLTLYTQDKPGGLPATRQGDAPPIMPLSVSAPELANAFSDEASHLTYTQNITLKFSADPSVMNTDADTRGRAFDAMTNAALGIERYLAATPGARQILAKRINAVKLAEGGKPTISIVGQTLLVSFVPGEDHEGHESSLAIQLELTKLLAGSVKDLAAK